ncbi:MAG: metal-dependent transcriptional regulator [Actinomycetia bacterium]|nr:metal-dependent transcriptional regulator [Actinomycetes bacterium]
MSGLIDTTEMYLRTVYELLEEGIEPRRARIAERLGHSGPTVSQTVARMERDGLLYLDSGRLIQLTDLGRQTAVTVMRRHRLVERLLVDVIGLDLDLVHQEACRWEHVVSPAVEERLVLLVSDPTVSPFGNPIPSAEGGGLATIERFRDGSHPLSEVVSEQPTRATVRRIGEHLQQKDTLAELIRSGATPGAAVEIQTVPRGVLIKAPQGETVISDTVAEHFFVSADPV